LALHQRIGDVAIAIGADKRQGSGSLVVGHGGGVGVGGLSVYREKHDSRWGGRGEVGRRPIIL
jgi:hypothetical protein